MRSRLRGHSQAQQLEIKYLKLLLKEKDKMNAVNELLLAGKGVLIAEKDKENDKADAKNELLIEDVLVAEKDVRISEKDNLMAILVSNIKYERDVASGRHSARAVLEAIIDDLGSFMKGESNLLELLNISWEIPRAKGVDLSTRTGILTAALGTELPILVAYLKDVADEQKISETQFLRDAGSLYEILSKRTNAGALPSVGTAGEPEALPTDDPDVFGRMPRTLQLAFFALARFTGRNVSLYINLGSGSPLDAIYSSGSLQNFPRPPTHPCQVMGIYQ